ARLAARKGGAVARDRDPVAVRNCARDLYKPTCAAGARGADQNLRRYSRAVLRPAAALRVRRVPARGELPVLGRLLCVHQPHLRLLRRVQAAVQHQAVEDVHRLLQLPAHCCHYRREDLFDARR
ncbi:hypothetical protein GGH17_006433, partial [Coemansia sp. RSA 788]